MTSNTSTELIPSEQVINALRALKEVTGRSVIGIEMQHGMSYYYELLVEYGNERKHTLQVKKIHASRPEPIRDAKFAVADGMQYPFSLFEPLLLLAKKHEKKIARFMDLHKFVQETTEKLCEKLGSTHQEIPF